MVVEQNASFHGKVAIVNGALQWGAGGWWYGPVRVVEEGGREWLTFVRENGEVWTELAAAGVASVSLYEHDRAVYGPMSLSA